MANSARPLPNSTADKPPRPRRWIPLSLRMFAAMMMILGPGSALWVGVPAYRQQIAIRQIERLGGVVGTKPRGPEWLRSWVGSESMKPLDAVDAVYLRQTAAKHATDDDMRDIAALPNLKTLVIYGTYPSIGDRGLSHFRQCTKLEAIKLIDTRVTDDGLAVLNELPNLRRLTLHRKKAGSPTLTDMGLTYLRPLRRLEWLRLTGGWVSGAAVEDLKHAMPHCKIETRDWYDIYDEPAVAWPWPDFED